MFVAEKFTGQKGKYVPVHDTVDGFAAIVDGKCDDIPESAFYNVGDITEVYEKAAKTGKGECSVTQAISSSCSLGIGCSTITIPCSLSQKIMSKAC